MVVQDLAQKISGVKLKIDSRFQKRARTLIFCPELGGADADIPVRASGAWIIRALRHDVFTRGPGNPVVHPAGFITGRVFRAALLVPPVLPCWPVSE